MYVKLEWDADLVTPGKEHGSCERCYQVVGAVLPYADGFGFRALDRNGGVIRTLSKVGHARDAVADYHKYQETCEPVDRDAAYH